jgi:hypothetical protein
LGFLITKAELFQPEVGHTHVEQTHYNIHTEYACYSFYP